MVTITLYAKQKKETQMYRTDFWTLWEKARVGYSEKIVLKQVYYQGWNRSPAQVGCIRQVLREDTEGWDGEGRGKGIRMGNTCKSMADSCQCMANSLQYCKVTSLQLTKINGRGKKENLCWFLCNQSQ